ncbi:YceI family protein [Streptomyces sp. NPDC048197]|uniref:YceI family protein n=1 Tax=Streptomyces sp. NPDC048197 TaxID=3365511 RepID=UPI0037176693
MSTTTALSELAGDYVIDPLRTRIGFVARPAMGARVRGRFEEFDGSAHVDGDDPSKSGIRLVIRARSIQTHHRLRDDQLRDTFFDAAHHPSLSFVSTTVQPLAPSGFRATGDLTIRGVTRPVTVDFALTDARSNPRGRLRVHFKGDFTINRNDWGVNRNAATRILISPKVTLELDVVAVRQG